MKCKKSIHWHAWANCCRSTSEGGLGFREISPLLSALVAKHVGRALLQPSALLWAQVYGARYGIINQRGLAYVQSYVAIDRGTQLRDMLGV